MYYVQVGSKKLGKEKKVIETREFKLNLKGGEQE